MKILLVDDDKIIRIGLAKMIKRIFEDNHEVVFNFQNGLVAFDYIKENKVDLVITDIKMPVMTGSELIEKAVNELENPPMFIVLSGYDEFTYVRDTMKLGAFNYLLKPLKQDDLKKVIDDEFKGEKVSIAANLPYYITTPIITKLLEEKLPIKNIVVMVQKEVAERMSAKPSTKDYGAITVLCQYYTEPSIVANVPASLFVPPPKVDSAVLKLKVLDKPSVEVKDEGVFFRVVKAAFSQRRKTLLNCLSANFAIPKDEISTLLESIGIAPSRRGETLSLEEFANIADTLLQKIK